MNYKQQLDHTVFKIISQAAQELNLECYVIGGFVRDILLNRDHKKDIDIVAVGSGIELAVKVSETIPFHPKVQIFKNYGTAMLHYENGKDDFIDVEFVGARKESYEFESRKPHVETGTLEDDQNRRDFTINAAINNDKLFNYYALSYDATLKKLTIIENSTELISRLLANPINFTNENPIVIGGNTFKGNLHDLRFWRKYITKELAVINMNSLFNGNELGLLGYWPMNEGNGIVANDMARFKHLVLNNTNWDIFPKGTAYTFDGTNYLKLDKVSKVNISKEMDATLTFWMKTNQTSAATLLSNGKGDATDAVESNGFRNKWSFDLTTTGGIELKAENMNFPFGTIKVNDDSWHHIALSLTRNGTIRMYVDGNEQGSYSSADLGGFVAANLFVGARGAINSVDNYYKGLIDELCIWNMSRSANQIKADQFYEVNFESTGLLLYSTFNKPETFR